jgi:hypothetical protein
VNATRKAPRTSNRTYVQRVTEASQLASEVTGNRVRLNGIGANIGNGVRYIDGMHGYVWYGAKGAQCAIAYYLGVVASTFTGTTEDFPPYGGRIPTAIHQRFQPMFDYVRWVDRVNPGNVDNRTPRAPDEWYEIGRIDAENLRRDRT